MYHSSITSIAGIIFALGVTSVTAQSRATPNSYGIDPTQPFNIIALNRTRAPYGWQINTYQISSNQIGLRAYLRDDDPPSAPPSRFTLVANHYGTQLHTIFGRTVYSSDTPSTRKPYTLHGGHDNELFEGNLDFLGSYRGDDPDVPSANYIKVYGDLNLNDFPICPGGGGKQIVEYQGRSARCISVVLTASAA